jgi:hypothetical protein
MCKPKRSKSAFKKHFFSLIRSYNLAKYVNETKNVHTSYSESDLRKKTAVNVSMKFMCAHTFNLSKLICGGRFECVFGCVLNTNDKYLCVRELSFVTFLLYIIEIEIWLSKKTVFGTINSVLFYWHIRIKLWECFFVWFIVEGYHQRQTFISWFSN